MSSAWGFVFRVQGLGFGIQGWGLGFRVSCFGSRVSRLDLVVRENMARAPHHQLIYGFRLTDYGSEFRVRPRVQGLVPSTTN